MIFLCDPCGVFAEGKTYLVCSSRCSQYVSMCFEICSATAQQAARDLLSSAPATETETSNRRTLAQTVVKRRCSDTYEVIWDMNDVPRPKPCHTHCHEPPIPPGPDHLKQLAHRFLSRLTEEQLRDIAAWCGQQKSETAIQVGSLCSGTECPVLAWSAWMEALQERLGVSPSWCHAMSAESDEKKQDFLLMMMPGVKIFTDACNLGASEAMAVTASSRQLETVPDDIGVLFAGFPCKAASRLNRHSGSSRNLECVSAGDLSTGSVFQSILSFLRLHGKRCQMLVMENVLGLAKKGPDGKSNLDCVLDMLLQAGWWAKAWHLDPRNWGTPASRLRVWIIGFPVSNVNTSGRTREATALLMQNVLDSIAGSKLAHMESYLLPDGHPYVKAITHPALYGRLCAAGERAMAAVWAHGIHPPVPARKASDDALRQKWHSAQLVEAMHSGVQMWRQAELMSQELWICYPGIAEVTNREMGILQLENTRFPEPSLSVIEMSQSACRGTGDQRQRRSAVKFHAVIPRTRQFLTNRCRVMTGLEALFVQNIRYPDDPAFEKASRFPDHFLRDLAGNAFEAGSCLAAICTATVAMSAGCASRCQMAESATIP